MKKLILAFAVVALGALASCKAQKSCPTYSEITPNAKVEAQNV